MNMHAYSVDQAQNSSANRTSLGRSAPRSRNGCATCKQRRVRCDEVRPVCGHCTRLQLNCSYRPWKRGNRVQTPRGPVIAGDQSTNLDFLSLSSGASSDRTTTLGNANSRTPRQPMSGYVTPTWGQSRGFDLNIFNDSWAGEFSCLFPASASPQAVVETTAPSSSDITRGLEEPVTAHSERAAQPRDASLTIPRGLEIAPLAAPYTAALNPTVEGDLQFLPQRDKSGSIGNAAHKMDFFRKIAQPPASILIGGFERWRRLQRYLCKLSQRSQAVQGALFCVIESLMGEEGSVCIPLSHKQHTDNLLRLHSAACEEMKSKITRYGESKPKDRDQLLAAIFLLAWFEVIRDQDEQSSLFPQELADFIIQDGVSWNRYSRQLLSWLNTLDSKATHLGGQHLLPPKSLAVVARFPIQITSSIEGAHGDHAKDEDGSDLSDLDVSPGSSHPSPDDGSYQPGLLQLGQVKHIMLNTVLQPALEWYLSSQSYCRRISAYDKHHRGRFTSDDEYEVVVACKQLEAELFELWDCRPSVMSLNTEQLEQVMSADLAVRLEEIFSVYLASFWILFVYLHRVSWWHLPHSPLAKRALEEVWKHLQRAYGEEINGPLHKVIHPSLLWPLFLFGSESPDEMRRTWAIEQLEALGEAKPVLENEGTNAETLPLFRLSAGATRNAKRAASLLRELIKEQEEANARVDDRDLSMKLFGCYFSIV